MCITISPQQIVRAAARVSILSVTFLDFYFLILILLTIESTHDFSFLIQTQIKTLIINIIDINDTKKFKQKPNCRVINLISN